MIGDKSDKIEGLLDLSGYKSGGKLKKSSFTAMTLLYRLLFEEKFKGPMQEKFIYGIEVEDYKKMNVKLHIHEKNTDQTYNILRLIKEQRKFVEISDIIDNVQMNDKYEEWYANNQTGLAGQGATGYDNNEGYQNYGETVELGEE